MSLPHAHELTCERPACVCQWTATTKDGGRSAQFEHTLLVTPTGVEAFTGRLPTSNPFFWEAEGYVAPEPRVVAAAVGTSKPAGVGATRSDGVGAAGGGGVEPTKGFAASAAGAKKAAAGKKAATKKKRKKK